jgi:hypothetical protein
MKFKSSHLILKGRTENNIIKGDEYGKGTICSYTLYNIGMYSRVCFSTNKEFYSIVGFSLRNILHHCHPVVQENNCGQANEMVIIEHFCGLYPCMVNRLYFAE